MTVRNARILDLTNLSGTFPSADPDGLITVAGELERQGFTIEEKALRFFPLDGSRPRVLR